MRTSVKHRSTQSSISLVDVLPSRPSTPPDFFRGSLLANEQEINFTPDKVNSYDIICFFSLAPLSFHPASHSTRTITEGEKQNVPRACIEIYYHMGDIIKTPEGAQSRRRTRKTVSCTNRREPKGAEGREGAHCSSCYVLVGTVCTYVL